MKRARRCVRIVAAFLCAVACTMAVPADSGAQDNATELLIEAGQLIEQQPNELVKTLLNQRLKEIVEIEDEAKRRAELLKLVASLQKKGQTAHVTDDTAKDGADGKANIEKEIEACNLLTLWTCSLYELDGRGFIVVRDQLVDEVDTHALSVESTRLFRRLKQACDDAEKRFRDCTYIQEDGAYAAGDVLGREIGHGVASSLVSGNALPLLIGAVRGLQGFHEIDAETNRALRIEIDSFKERLSDLLYDINSRRSELQAEHDVKPDMFITRSLAKALVSSQESAMAGDRSKERALLQKCLSICPNFRDARYALAESCYKSGQYGEAQKLLTELVASPSRVLRRDELIGVSYSDLAFYAIKAGQYADAVDHASNAISALPSFANAYRNRAVAKMHLDQGESAWSDLQESLKFEPANPWAGWVACRIAAKCYGDDNTALWWLKGAVDRGFNRFDLVLAFAPLQDALATNRAKWIMQPRVGAFYKSDGAHILGFWDEVLVRNDNTYTLTSVHIRLQVVYLDGSTWKAVNKHGKWPVLRPGQCGRFDDVLYMDVETCASLAVTFTSDQNPEPVRSVTLYHPHQYLQHIRLGHAVRSLEQHYPDIADTFAKYGTYNVAWSFLPESEYLHLPLSSAKNSFAWAILEAGRKGNNATVRQVAQLYYPLAAQEASEGLDIDYWQNPNTLDTYAQLCWELAKPEVRGALRGPLRGVEELRQEARRWQAEAIRIYEREHGEVPQSFRDTLKRFNEE